MPCHCNLNGFNVRIFGTEFIQEFSRAGNDNSIISICFHLKHGIFKEINRIGHGDGPDYFFLFLVIIIINVNVMDMKKAWNFRYPFHA